MPHIDIPLFGTVVLCTMMLAAGYTLMASLLATRGRPRFLEAARMGTFATCALVALAVLVLAYAFQTHDFRIRYVSRYSDRSMSAGYLVTALWGGQDGSLLWWTFLLSGYTTACTLWMRRRYAELQPWVLATLMTIFLFFGVLMLFAANPFAVNAAGPPVDGEGLNPLLQNYWMAIHPPTLYLGFVGWAIPFAFVVAALATGRLHDEWLLATRRWVLFAWLALAIGNVLGMLWSYEELGWGGYWAWDPVENAAFMPLLVGTAYVHSVMIQERRGMLKVWNVFLLCLTFFMTIFGTFLTRSGLIASVHSFARSDIGIYFVGYMAILLVVCAALIVWRLPKLKAENTIDALLSREFAFLLNNWILLGMMVFVLVATTFPLISEALRDETVTVGPGFYNRWMVPLGLVLLFLTGVGPLIAWRRASLKSLGRTFVIPAITAVVAGIALLIAGAGSSTPGMIAYTFSAFVLASIALEFWRGTRARRTLSNVGWLRALGELVSRNRRRYGGYVVHAAIVLLAAGIAGSSAYGTETEGKLKPGQSLSSGGYTVTYRSLTREPKGNHVELRALVDVYRGGKKVGVMAPGKNEYLAEQQISNEMAIRTDLLRAEDLNLILDQPNEDGSIFLKMVVKPLVNLIWLAGLIFVLGSVITLWPDAREQRRLVERYQSARAHGRA